MLVDWLPSRATRQTGVNLGDNAFARKRIAETPAGVLPMIREHGNMDVDLP